MDSASGSTREDESLSQRITKSASLTDRGTTTNEPYLLITQSTLSCLQQIAAGADPMRPPIGLVAGDFDLAHHCIQMVGCSRPIPLYLFHTFNARFLMLPPSHSDVTNSGAGSLPIGPQLAHAEQPIRRAGARLVGYYYFHCSHDTSGRINGLLDHREIIRYLRQALEAGESDMPIVVVKLQSIVHSAEAQGVEAGVRLDFYHLTGPSSGEDLASSISPLPFRLRNHQYHSLADLQARLLSTIPPLELALSCNPLQYDIHLSQVLLAGGRMRAKILEDASARLSTSLLHLKWLIYQRVEEMQQKWKADSRPPSQAKTTGQDGEADSTRFRSLLNQLVSKELAPAYSDILDISSRDNHLLWQPPSLRTPLAEPAGRGSKKKKMAHKVVSMNGKNQGVPITSSPVTSTMAPMIAAATATPSPSSLPAQPSSSSSHPRPILPASTSTHPRTPSSDGSPTPFNPTDADNSGALMAAKLSDSLLLLAPRPGMASTSVDSKDIVMTGAGQITHVDSTAASAVAPSTLALF